MPSPTQLASFALLAGATLLAGAALAAEPARPTGARGGFEIVEALEASPVGVVGRIDQVRAIDAHGYAASIWVEAGLGAASARIEPGTPIEIAWEELAQDRPPRFAEMDRVEPGESVVLRTVAEVANEN